MSSVDLKGDDKYIQSPTNTVPSRTGYDGDGDEDMSPESISATSRKESHRASERKRRERLSMSMNTLDSIIRQTRKFANKKSVKLDKNSIIEHAIAYIRELQQVNALYAKRLEEANSQISSLQSLLMNNHHINPVVPVSQSESVPYYPYSQGMNSMSTWQPPSFNSFDNLIQVATNMKDL
ncbi:hypothetical protein WA171_002553 [Blastocystis sp. BT1]